MGTLLRKELEKLGLTVRGKGLLIGVQTDNSQKIVQEALKKGLLLVPAANNTVRLLPPINIREEACYEALEILKKIL